MSEEFDMGAMDEDYEVLKRQEAERERRRTGRITLVKGNQNGIFLAPTNMKDEQGRPLLYKMRGAHYKCGPEGKKTITCLRDKATFEVSLCPQCIKNAQDFESGSDTRIKQGKKRVRKQKYIWGAVDMSSFISRDGIPYPQEEWLKVPQCFGNYVSDEDAKGFKRCKKCVETPKSWGRTCMMGVCTFTIGPMLYEPIYKHLKMDGNVTKKGNAQIVIINKKIPKKDADEFSQYSITGWSKVVFPEKVWEWIISNLPDLPKVFPPKSKEETKAIMEGVELEELEAADLPDCFADPNVFDPQTEKCTDCEALKMCESEIKATTQDEEEKAPVKAKEEVMVEIEEDEEEEGDIVDLSKLDRDRLKKFIREQELGKYGVKVFTRDTDDDLREKIVKAIEQKEKEKSQVEEEELEEEEEPLEEEPLEEDEVPLEDKFTNMDRRALKIYNEKRTLGVRVYKSLSDEDLRQAIREAEIKKNATGSIDDDIDEETALEKRIKEVAAKKPK